MVDGIATAIGTGVELATIADDVVVGLRVGVDRELGAVLEDAPAAVDVSVVDNNIVPLPETDVD